MTSSAPGELLAELATHASQAETPQGTTTGHVSAKKMSGGTFFKRREALEKGVWVDRAKCAESERDTLRQARDALLNDAAKIAQKDGTLYNAGGFTSTDILQAYKKGAGKRNGLESYEFVHKVLKRAFDGARVLDKKRANCVERVLHLSIERRGPSAAISEVHQDSTRNDVLQFVACLSEEIPPPVGVFSNVKVEDGELCAVYGESGLCGLCELHGVHPALLWPPGKFMRCASPLAPLTLKMGDIIVFTSQVPHYSPAGKGRDLLFGVISFSEEATFDPDADRMIPSLVAMEVASKVSTPYKVWELWSAEGVDVSLSLTEPISGYVKAKLRKCKKKEDKLGQKQLESVKKLLKRRGLFESGDDLRAVNVIQELAGAHDTKKKLAKKSKA